MLKNWLIAIRPKTLPASLSPVILGTSLAFPTFIISNFLAACGCALFFQIAVNLANDFADAESGVDTKDRLGPLRVTQSGLIPAKNVKLACILFVLLAFLCGLFLVFKVSFILLFIGIICSIATFAYSSGPFPFASNALGEVMVLIFFGWIAVIGSYFIQTNTLNWTVFGFANSLGIIIAAIMLVNNIRDIENDGVARKKTLAVRMGKVNSQNFYIAMLIVSMLVHLVSGSSWGWVVLIPMVLSLPLIIILCLDIKKKSDRQLNNVLAETALLSLCYSLTCCFVLVLVK